MHSNILILNFTFYILHSVAGGGSRIRTGDFLLAKQALYQLSYAPSRRKAKGEG